MRILTLGLAALPAAALLAACAQHAVPTTTAASATATPAATAAPAAGADASRFLASPPVIDGKADDWGSDSLRYDPGSHLQYQVLNDARTLYVRLRSADASTQAKLTLLGMTVWLDSTGRNQQQLGVRYPLGIDLSTLKGSAARPPGALGPTAAERQAEHVARLRSAILDARTIELLKFRGSKEPVLTDSDAPLGVKAALNLDAKDNLIYELAVPLRLIYKRVPALAAGRAAAVGVWLVGNQPPRDPKQEPDQSMMQGNTLGSYGNYGGAGGRAYRGGGPQAMQTFALKISAQLAGK